MPEILPAVSCIPLVRCSSEVAILLVRIASEVPIQVSKVFTLDFSQFGFSILIKFHFQVLNNFIHFLPMFVFLQSSLRDSLTGFLFKDLYCSHKGFFCLCLMFHSCFVILLYSGPAVLDCSCDIMLADIFCLSVCLFVFCFYTVSRHLGI